MRREKLYLTDILEACDAISRFCKGMERGDFLHNELLQSAILQKLIVIGEAASRLPLEFRENHPGIEWTDIVGFRNIAVHEYFSVNWDIVWVTVTQDVPLLREKAHRILREEYTDE